LLCGNAGAPMLLNCHRSATKRFGSIADKVFSRVNQGASRFVDVGHDQGEVQFSPKSERVSFILFAALPAGKRRLAAIAKAFQLPRVIFCSSGNGA
jgi:hypothetical protein